MNQQDKIEATNFICSFYLDFIILVFNINQTYKTELI